MQLSVWTMEMYSRACRRLGSIRNNDRTRLVLIEIEELNGYLQRTHATWASSPLATTHWTLADDEILYPSWTLVESKNSGASWPVGRPSRHDASVAQGVPRWTRYLNVAAFHSLRAASRTPRRRAPPALHNTYQVSWAGSPSCQRSSGLIGRRQPLPSCVTFLNITSYLSWPENLKSSIC